MESGLNHGRTEFGDLKTGDFGMSKHVTDPLNPYVRMVNAFFKESLQSGLLREAKTFLLVIS